MNFVDLLNFFRRRKGPLRDYTCITVCTSRRKAFFGSLSLARQNPRIDPAMADAAIATPGNFRRCTMSPSSSKSKNPLNTLGRKTVQCGRRQPQPSPPPFLQYWPAAFRSVIVGRCYKTINQDGEAEVDCFCCRKSVSHCF